MSMARSQYYEYSCMICAEAPIDVRARRWCNCYAGKSLNGSSCVDDLVVVIIIIIIIMTVIVIIVIYY
jgi:hypothetical protein